MNLETMFIGKSTAARKLRREIPEFTKSNRILLIGEKGAGKSFVARLIYESSKRTKLHILSPSTSTEQTIKEAFEGANSNTVIVLKGIEEFSFLNQGIIVQCLNALSKKSAVQVIATSQKSLAVLKKEETMLKDLTGALRGFETLAVPPLGERTEDIPMLVEHFAREACKSVGNQLKVVDINTLDFLVRRQWKENVLELKSVIERSVLTSPGESMELPSSLVNESEQLQGIVESIHKKQAFAFDKSLSNLEKTLIEKTLEVVGYHQTKTAEILNITPQNLRYRLKKFKILVRGK